MAKERTRLEGEDRRRSIIDAARSEFAQNGFSDTSLKDLARAANVSTALIYAYFENKEALFDAVQESRLNTLDPIKNEVEAIAPGAEALVLIVFDLFKRILAHHPARDDGTEAFEKLQFRSLLGDGAFARRHNKNMDKYLISDFVQACFIEAERNGDMAKLHVPVNDRMHFAHQLAGALNLAHVSGRASFDYDSPKWQLVENAAVFCLRGIGMTDEAMAKYYQPEKLRATVRRLHSLSRDNGNGPG